MQSTTLFSVHLGAKNIIEPTCSNQPSLTPPSAPLLIDEITEDQEEDKVVSHGCEYI